MALHINSVVVFSPSWKTSSKFLKLYLLKMLPNAVEASPISTTQLLFGTRALLRKVTSTV